MKVNLTLTPVQNVLALLNDTNAQFNAIESQLTIGAPAVINAPTDGRNTSVLVTAVADAGFAGEQTYTYTRLGLVAGGAIATAKAAPVTIVATDTTAEIKTKLATALGLLESEFTLTNIVEPQNENTPGSADLVANATSYLYVGTYSAQLAVADSDKSLSQAAPTTTLNGFDPEA